MILNAVIPARLVITSKDDAFAENVGNRQESSDECIGQLQVLAKGRCKT